MLHNRQFVLDSINLNHINNDLSVAGKPNKISMEIMAEQKNGVDTLSGITNVNGEANGVYASETAYTSNILSYATFSGEVTHGAENTLNGVGFEFDFNFESTGPVHSIEIIEAGSGYSAETGKATTGGSGAALQVDIGAVSGEGAITSVTVNSSSEDTGYKVGDVITVSGGDGNATLKIKQIIKYVKSVTINHRGYGYSVNDVVTVPGSVFDADPSDVDLTIGSVSPSIIDIRSTVLGHFRVLSGTKMNYDLSPCSFRPDNIRMDVFYSGSDGSLHYDLHTKREELTTASAQTSKPGFRIYINFNISYEPFHK